MIKNRFTYKIFLILFCFVHINGNSQLVSNVRFEQVDKVIYIYYDLTGEKNQSFNVKVYCSTDDENSWGNPLLNVSGDVGEMQTPGFNKKIAWNVLSEKEKLSGIISFKVVINWVVFRIGQKHGGGVIFYIDGTGQHGLIASTSDQGKAAWGCYGNTILGTSPDVGTGQANTTAIISKCSKSGIAARICNSLDSQGYSDWFLPSIGELELMYQQKKIIGGFTNHNYWSSSEYYPNGINLALYIYFGDGQHLDGIKDGVCFVRAVRAF